MDTCNAVGCFKPRYISSGGKEYTYCQQHLGNQTIDFKREETGDEITMDLDTCRVEGCSKRRYINAKGLKFSFCHEHQKEDWARAKRNKYQAAPTKQAAAPAVMPADEPTIQVMTLVQKPIHNCTDCAAKDVIEALRAKSPKLAKLIDAMQAEVEAARELGL
jgi:hypothetical protein